MTIRLKNRLIDRDCSVTNRADARLEEVIENDRV